MSGISLSTALQIVANAHDLYIVPYTKVGGDDRYGFVIMRGPGHGFLPLVTVSCIYPSFEDVAGPVKELLLGLEECVVGVLTDTSNPGAQELQPDEDSLKNARVFSAGLADRIAATLRERKPVATWEMNPA